MPEGRRRLANAARRFAGKPTKTSVQRLKADDSDSDSDLDDAPNSLGQGPDDLILGLGHPKPPVPRTGPQGPLSATIPQHLTDKLDEFEQIEEEDGVLERRVVNPRSKQDLQQFSEESSGFDETTNTITNPDLIALLSPGLTPHEQDELDDYTRLVEDLEFSDDFNQGPQQTLAEPLPLGFFEESAFINPRTGRRVQISTGAGIPPVGRQTSFDEALTTSSDEPQLANPTPQELKAAKEVFLGRKNAQALNEAQRIEKNTTRINLLLSAVQVGAAFTGVGASVSAGLAPIKYFLAQNAADEKAEEFFVALEGITTLMTYAQSDDDIALYNAMIANVLAEMNLDMAKAFASALPVASEFLSFAPAAVSTGNFLLRRFKKDKPSVEKLSVENIAINAIVLEMRAKKAIEQEAKRDGFNTIDGSGIQPLEPEPKGKFSRFAEIVTSKKARLGLQLTLGTTSAIAGVAIDQE